MIQAPFRSRCLCPLSAVLLALTSAAAGPASPSAGALLRDVRPAAPVTKSTDAAALPADAAAAATAANDAGPRVRVRAVRFTGASVLPSDALQPLVADALGRELNLTELRSLAERVTRRYREAGYLLARAYLPPQDIVDGALEIAVLEGQLGRVSIANTSRLSDRRVAERLADLRTGEPLRGGALERDLLLLNELPGARVISTLRPGASVGTADLDVRLVATSRLAGGLAADNHGNRYTGRLRFSADASAANLAGLADSFELRGVFSEGMRYGRAAWQLPVGPRGWQVGVAASAMRYELGGDFAALDARGTATVGSVYALYPLVRSRRASLDFQIDYDRKHLVDHEDALALRAEKDLDVLQLGLSGHRQDGWGGGGVWTWSATGVVGRLRLDPIAEVADRFAHDTQGGYGKFALALGRQQALPQGFTLGINLQAQLATQNLDASEKLGLGGPSAVRASPPGEAPSDDGWLASVELRRALTARWQAGAFFDAASGRLNHRALPSDGDDTRALSGAGLSLAGELPYGVSLRASVAWNTGDRAASEPGHSPRVWLQAGKRF